ncbi:hypothetical protein K439DRAFT_1631242 [Ramaria rubella]|nr:hypothetical protein K439DRAFT_1631242 [Ramaria rubella]
MANYNSLRCASARVLRLDTGGLPTPSTHRRPPPLPPLTPSLLSLFLFPFAFSMLSPVYVATN